MKLLSHTRTSSVQLPSVSGPSSTGYQRYSIETRNVPPRRKLPYPFIPKVKKIGLAKIVLHEVLEYGFKLRQKEYADALLSRPCIYGTFSGRFGGFRPIKEKCTGCMRCVQEYPNVCSVRRNPEFYSFADSYWESESEATTSGSPVATVNYEAETGKIPIKGMGYKGPFAGPGWDSIWTDMSEIVRPTRDGVYGREFISTVVDVGGTPRMLEFNNGHVAGFSRTVAIPLPIIFDYLPPNLTSQSIMESVASASTRTGTFFVASPSQAGLLSETQTRQQIPIIPGDYSDSISSLNQAATKMVELEVNDSSGLEDAYLELRRLNPGLIISVRLPLNQKAADEAVHLARSGVDVLHLTANYHGEGGDERNPRFIKDLIREVHGRLVSENYRDEVTLIASGGITRAEHVPKAIICGADLVAIDTTILVALQARFEGECASVRSGRIVPESFDPSWGEQRLVNLLGSWHDQLIEILSAMGMRDVRRLRGDVGRAMFNEDLEKEAFMDIARRA